MINFINSWTRGIIIAVIISTIIEMILPNGSIKKYVRSIIGVYIVFVIISPIITKVTGKKFNLKEYELPETKKYEVTSLDTNVYIENTYIGKLEQEIKDSLNNEGYTVEKIYLEIDKTNENYGNLNSINMNVIKNELKKSNNIKQIEKIKIDVNEYIEKNKNELSNEDIEKIKNIINFNFRIIPENIHINE